MRTPLILSCLFFVGCPTSEDAAPADETGMPQDSLPDDPLPDLAGTEGEVQDLLVEFGDSYPGYADAAGRLLDAYTGGTPDGVTLTPPADLRTGTVQVDKNLNGTFDENWDVMLSQPGGEGPVSVSARNGTYYDASSTDIDVEMSTDGEVVNADQASISVFGEEVTLHGSSGAFEFSAVPTSGTSAGKMGFVAYTSNPSDEVVNGEIDLVADGMGGYVLQTSFEESTLRGVPVSVPLSCHCEGDDGCSQGPAPGSFLAVSALLGLIANRRRRRR